MTWSRRLTLIVSIQLILAALALLLLVPVSRSLAVFSEDLAGALFQYVDIWDIPVWILYGVYFAWLQVGLLRKRPGYRQAALALAVPLVAVIVSAAVAVRATPELARIQGYGLFPVAAEMLLTTGIAIASATISIVLWFRFERRRRRSVILGVGAASTGEHE